ncbi:hypothetical protein C1646_762550 [Rhizophagus diaphanus]|nr:hypothetical protein C1646_762550 [Rhizophagus diaphanus] [Rhizophagus sp. MUCL 43196]
MSMMCSFWMTNIKKEMAFHGKEITADDLRQYELDEYDFDDDTSEDSESSDYAIRSTSLDISSIANLDHAIFNRSHQVVQTNLNRDLVPDNLEYNVGNLVSRFLNEEHHDV